MSTFREEISAADLGISVSESEVAARPQLISLREAERRHIEYVLRQVDGNKAEACRILDLVRSTLYKKIGESS